MERSDGYFIKTCLHCKHDVKERPCHCSLGHRQVRNMANGCKDFDGELSWFNRKNAKVVYTRTWQRGD